MRWVPLPTIAAWAMVALLLRGARPMGEVAQFDTRFFIRTRRILLASAIMGGALWGESMLLNDMLLTQGWRYLALVLLVLSGMVIYFVVGHLIGALSLSDFRRNLRR